MRRRVLYIVGGVLLGLLVAVAVAAYWLLFTQAGLEFALRQLDRVPNMTIEIDGVEGTLAGPLAARRVLVDHEALHLEAGGLRIAVQARTLLAGRLTLTEAAVEQLSVQLKPQPEQPKTKTRFLPRGFSIRAPSFRLADVDVTLQNGQRLEADEIRGALTLTRRRLKLDPIHVRGPQGQLEGSLALRATEPLGLRTNLRGEWRLPDDDFDYRFRVQTSGKLDRLAAELYLDAPAKLNFSGTLLDLTDNPRARGTFRMVDFDGTPWVEPGGIPRLSGTVALAAGTRGVGFDGTFTSPTLPGQPVRLQGGVRFADRAIDLRSFRLWLPRIGSEFTATGTVALAGPDAPEGTLPSITLSGGWSALRWPLDETAEEVVASPHGVFTFEGSMPYAFTTKTEVGGPAIPRTSLELAGTLDRQTLVLERLDGAVLNGRVLGRGRLAWSGEQPWRFEVEARSLELDALRRGVDGRLDLRASIAGTGLSAEAPWTAQLESLSGTLFGRPLTGRGEIAHRNGVYDLRRVRIANGESFADIDGKVGARDIDLAWNVDLRSLAIVADGMGGELVSRGTARGTLQQPQVTARAYLRRFSFGGVRASTAVADIDVDSSDRRPSRVSIDADRIVIGGFRFDTMSAGLGGLLADHEFTFAFSSPGDRKRHIQEFRGGISAQGGFDAQRRRWQGDLAQVDIVFPDGDAHLIQPAALTLGADLHRVAPLCVRTDEDSRLCVEGEYQPAQPAWRFIYSAQDWPLKRILRTLLGWREFDGRLQASGWAEQMPGQPWIGGSTLLLHEPTFDVPRNKFRSERVQLGSSRLDLFADPTTIRADLGIVVDETTTVAGHALVDRRADLLESPVSGRLEGKSAAIKVLPLLVPEIDRAAGSIEGQVTLAGTLGEPQFNGSFHLRDGQLELYRTNLILANLKADGAFTGDELRFDASGQTKGGRLTVDGDFTWPQGVMTGAMRLRGNQLLVADTPELRIVASPDIVLNAGTDGYDVQGEVRIPVARISPRELTSSVSTSPDERIVGVPDIDETDEPSTTDRFQSRINVLLGDAVRVEAYGLKARLEGDVTVSTRPEDIARGNGTIRVVDGQYKAFGQDVRITKGVLRYVDAPLSEPQLEIVAEREIKDSDVTVAVNVRGTLDNPYISITSTPSMTSNEALSYLLTGRSIDTLQSGEAASVNQAAENLAVSGGGLLLGGLGTRLGLDEVTVERDADAGDTQVVLGKALSPKLFVSYGISIAEAINTIKLRYTLNERWSIKAEAGLEQSADIEYRIER